MAYNMGILIKVLYTVGRVDKASFGESPDAACCDSKRISAVEVSFGPGPVERRGMGVLCTVCH